MIAEWKRRKVERKRKSEREWGNHKRRIELEDMAKVVASDWGTESLPP